MSPAAPRLGRRRRHDAAVEAVGGNVVDQVDDACRADAEPATSASSTASPTPSAARRPPAGVARRGAMSRPRCWLDLIRPGHGLAASFRNGHVNPDLTPSHLGSDTKFPAEERKPGRKEFTRTSNASREQDELSRSSLCPFCLFLVSDLDRPFCHPYSVIVSGSTPSAPSDDHGQFC